MAQAYDVIVVGGGFAGATAARDLQHWGHRVLVVEARDRLGGRVWTSEFCGLPVELGGTWVHWHQPHVWSELSRYGLGIVESLDPETATLFVEDQPQRMSVEAVETLITEVGDQIIDDARAAFERPYDPSSWNLSSLDALSIADRIEAAGFDAESWSAADSAYSGVSSAYCREAGLSPLLHWQALSGFDTSLAWDCTERYAISSGATSLIDAIVKDGGFDIRLQAPVDAIEQSPAKVEVAMRDGQRLQARAVVVAVPVNTLHQISFSPGLSRAKQEMSSERQASHGFKVWVLVRGPMNELALAPSAWAATDVAPHARTPDGDTLCLAFGSDASRLDPGDTTAVAAAINRLLPDHEVLATLAHDWTADEFSQGTWRPTVPTRSPVSWQLCSSLIGACSSPAQTSPAAGTGTSTGQSKADSRPHGASADS